MRSRLTAAGLAAGLVLLTLAGCGAGRDTDRPASSGGGGGTAPEQGAPSSDGKPGANEGSPPDTGSAPSTSNRVTLQRAQILTADLTVRARNADDVGNVADRAIKLVQGLGGDVAGDQRMKEGSQTRADVNLKVPPAKYADAISQLAGLGKEVQRSAKSQDVTDEIVDVNSRISSQTASVERVRKLLASARNLGDIVTIEGELAKRQADLEALKARQRALDAQTVDATITLHVQSPAVADTPKKEEDKRGFLAGLDAGWTAFTASVTVLLTLVGALVPFLGVAAIVAGLVWLVLRRRQPRLSPAPTGTE